MTEDKQPYLPEYLDFNEKELLLQVASGSELAFRHVFVHYYDLVYSTALRFLKQDVLAQDATQQAFMQLWVHRSQLTEVSNLEDYLFILVRNLLVGELRKKATEEKYLKHLKNHFNSEYFEVQDKAFDTKDEIINRAINNLPYQQQQVYRFSREEGLSQLEIAQKMNISVPTVKWHMKEALKRLYSTLASKKNELFNMALVMYSLLVGKNL